MSKVQDGEEMNPADVNWALGFEVPGDLEMDFSKSICTGFLYWKVFTDYTNILFCAQEKSGSHHINLLLSMALGYHSHPIGYNQKGNKIYFPRVLAAKFLGKNTISRCHAPSDLDVTRLIRNLDLKPLVLTRNLLDALVSRCDHIKRTDVGDDIKSTTQFRKFYRGDNEYQLDIAIEMFANKFINFFTSWEAYNGELIHITYEEMVEDEIGLVNRVAETLGCEVVGDVEEISSEIKKAGGANFNKGVIGRGRELLNERQKKEIGRRADILGCDDEQFLGGL
jgi:hypothetical protein